MTAEAAEILTLVAIGAAAGSIGGLVGLGGAIVVIPGLTLLVRVDQHLAQAAAMILNVCIAVPSVWRHHAAAQVPWRAVARCLPAGILCIVLGVESSNALDGAILKRLFACFLIYATFQKIRRIYLGPQDLGEPKVTWPRCSMVGGIVGFFAGLLGIGGGPIAVPLLRWSCHLRLRACIGASSAIMCVTSLVGATRKNMALEGLTDVAGEPLGLTMADSLHVVVWMAPPAVVGALFGATLTHKIPVTWLRIAFIVFMILAIVAMLDPI